MTDRTTIHYGTAAEARALRVHKYVTGLACKKGHFAPRYTSTNCCVRCNIDAARGVNAQRLGERHTVAVRGRMLGPQPFVHIKGDWSPLVYIPPGWAPRVRAVEAVEEVAEAEW